jgi:hypothetical protein
MAFAHSLLLAATHPVGQPLPTGLPRTLTTFAHPVLLAATHPVGQSLAAVLPRTLTALRQTQHKPQLVQFTVSSAHPDAIAPALAPG